MVLRLCPHCILWLDTLSRPLASQVLKARTFCKCVMDTCPCVLLMVCSLVPLMTRASGSVWLAAIEKCLLDTAVSAWVCALARGMWAGEQQITEWLPPQLLHTWLYQCNCSCSTSSTICWIAYLMLGWVSWGRPQRCWRIGGHNQDCHFNNLQAVLYARVRVTLLGILFCRVSCHKVDFTPWSLVDCIISPTC